MTRGAEAVPTPHRELVIFGAGQTAEIAHFYFTHDSDHEVVAFTVDGTHLGCDRLSGLPVIPFEDLARHHPPERCAAFVAMSFAGLNKPRAAKLEALRAAGYRCISYVSSKAAVWPDLTHGENCFILEHNTIQPLVTLGDDVFLWSGNHVGHHTTLGNHIYVASQVVISGAVQVGDYCFIGVNATLRDNIQIGAESVIGAGCLILSDAPERSVFKGAASTPARVTSDRLRHI